MKVIKGWQPCLTKTYFKIDQTRSWSKGDCKHHNAHWMIKERRLWVTRGFTACARNNFINKSVVGTCECVGVGV